MSIIIKGMDMPKKCGDCVCELYLWCGAKQKPIDDLESKPSWCPLIEIPDVYIDISKAFMTELANKVCIKGDIESEGEE